MHPAQDRVSTLLVVKTDADSVKLLPIWPQLAWLGLAVWKVQQTLEQLEWTNCKCAGECEMAAG